MSNPSITTDMIAALQEAEQAPTPLMVLPNSYNQTLEPIIDNSTKLEAYRFTLRQIANIKRVEGEGDMAFFQAMQQMRRAAIAVLQKTGDGV